ASCAEPPQGFGALVLQPNQGAHLVPPCEQEFGEVAADATHSASCSGHEDRLVVFMIRRHVADLGLLQKTNWRGSALERTAGGLRTFDANCRCGSHWLMTLRAKQRLLCPWLDFVDLVVFERH